MNLEELAKMQENFDRKYFQHNAPPSLRKIRHITLHLGKLLGKLSNYCEHQEHGKDYPTKQIETEVTPDLMIYAFQLANLLGIDLEKRYLERLEQNKRSNRENPY